MGIISLNPRIGVVLCHYYCCNDSIHSLNFSFWNSVNVIDEGDHVAVLYEYKYFIDALGINLELLRFEVEYRFVLYYIGKKMCDDHIFLKSKIFFMSNSK